MHVHLLPHLIIFTTLLYFLFFLKTIKEHTYIHSNIITQSITNNMYAIILPHNLGILKRERNHAFWLCLGRFKCHTPKHFTTHKPSLDQQPSRDLCDLVMSQRHLRSRDETFASSPKSRNIGVNECTPFRKWRHLRSRGKTAIARPLRSRDHPCETTANIARLGDIT